MENKTGVILDRASLLASEFTSDELSRSMYAVHVTADGTAEATNGHYLIRVPPCAMPAEDFPAVVGMGTGFNGTGLLLPADACKAALKTTA